MSAHHSSRKKLRASLAIGVIGVTAIVVAQTRTEAQAAPLLRWNATIDRVVDGDTVEVRVDGEPGITVVRIGGLQTNELYRDDPRPSECWATEATDRLTDLLDGERVVLRARNESSSSIGRPIRHVFLDEINVAATMLREGFGIPVVFPEEPDYAITNTNEALQAAAAEVGVWDMDGCGPGPSRNAIIDMVTNYDAAGVDDDNVNGEYVQLRNLSADAIDLDGWQVRDTSLRRFPLPDGYVLAPGGRLRIYVGRGTDTSDSIFLGESEPILGNDSDGMFLYDPDFDIRAWDMWPCTDTCAAPPPLVIDSVNYDAPGDDQLNPNGEFITIRNTGATTIDFRDWLVEVPPLQLTSVRSRPIAPGATLTIFVGRGTNTNDTMYLNQDLPILNNSQHIVLLQSPDRILASCNARGALTCPKELLIAGSATATARAVRVGA